MFRSLKPVFIAIILALALVPGFADESTITLGGAGGWPHLSLETGIAHGKGRLGKDALVLSSKLPAKSPAAFAPASGDETTDLYFSFDDGSFSDAAGNYDVKSNALRNAGGSKPRRGNGAALCNTDGAGLVLRGKAGSLFSSSGDVGSFSVEFWLYPAVAENGSVVFEWRSSRLGPVGSTFQTIRAGMFRNHLEWVFSNVFAKTAGAPIDITLKGKKNLVPGSWSQHRISYDAESGLLEYRLDGAVEDVAYATTSGGESGDVYPAMFGTPADVSIGSRFSGLIDELRVTRSASSSDSLDDRHASLDRYASAGGRFETMPIDSGGLESTLAGLSIVESTPAGTGTAYFVRAGDNFYEWNQDYPSWIPVVPGKKIVGVVGKYFQVAGELYPSGDGNASPSVTSITLHYAKDTTPWPPSKVFATAGDGSVTVEWTASIDFDTAGYLVYYGERPGEYLGAGSPVDAGAVRSFTVTGLKNGKAYYFCVAAYDASGPKFPGTLSAEAWARPLAVHGNAGN
jgi:hypothetical protein